MKTRDKIILGALSFVTIIVIINLIKSILFPFVFSFIISYFLSPLVKKMHDKYRISHISASSLILGLFLSTTFCIMCLLVPFIYDQINQLIYTLPSYFKIVIKDFYPEIITILNRFGIDIENNLSHLLSDQQITNHIISFSKRVINNTISSSFTLINFISLFFIIPVLLFYLLKDWENMIEKIKEYLPKKRANTIKEIFTEIDKTISGYLRGQINVCLILSLIYGSLLAFSGLKFGFLVGFITGLISFIPYVGPLTGATTGIILALLQWGLDFKHLAIVSGIFILVQIIESDFLTPKLVGKKVGLHPAWIIFGLFFFGKLFGFVGILLAIPLTAICGVITRYISAKYKETFT